MKKMKLLLVMLVVVLMSVCGCSKDEKTNEQDGVEEAPVEEAITNIDDTSYVQYTDNTTTITLESIEGIWYFEGDQETWVDQNKAFEIVEAASYLTSKDVVKDAGALADYGLETPAYTVIVKDATGNETTIYIGKILEDGTYYATTGEKDVVYIISEQLAGTLEFNKELLKTIVEDEGIVEEEIPEEDIPEEEIVEEEIVEEEIVEEDIPEEE